MIKLYICCLVLIIGSVEVGPDIDMKFHQEVMKIVSYDIYMGHQVSIIENIPHITPVKNRVEAIVKLDLPKSPKNYKQFCGMVNYLSMFLKD